MNLVGFHLFLITPQVSNKAPIFMAQVSCSLGMVQLYIFTSQN